MLSTMIPSSSSSSSATHTSSIPVDELKNILHNVLEQRGTLNHIRTVLRNDIYHSLQGDTDTSQPQHHINSNVTKPLLKNSHIHLIINELIREYLVYNQY